MSKSLPTIAITGASGFLGSALVDYFLEKKWHVIGLVRNPGSYSPQKNLTYLNYDLAQRPGSQILHGVDYLVHAAYAPDAPAIDAFSLNIAAAEQLLEAARTAQVRKCIFISSMSAHEAAVSVYGRQKLAIEALFTEAHGISIRPGLIIGNGGIVQKMFRLMRKLHIVPLVGGGKQPVQIIAIDDLVQAVDLAISQMTGTTLTIAHPHIYTYRALYKQFAEHLNIRALFVPVPYFLLLTIFKILELTKLPVGISGDSVKGLRKLQAVKTQADLTRLGLQTKNLEQSLRNVNI